MKTIVVGDGTVGKALGKAIGCEVLDKSDESVSASTVIICVPTPTEDGVQDLSAVRQALSRVKEAQLIILRSTVLPGTTDKLQETSGIPLMFVPEWGFEATMEEDLARPQYHVLGYTDKSADLTDLATEVLPKSYAYTIVTAKAAEFSKYFANIWGMSQIMLANSLYDWVGDKDTYEQAVAAAKLHKNIPQWGWKVDDQGGRGAAGKCLPKDLHAAMSDFPHPLWLAYRHYNNDLRRESGK